MTLGPVTVDWSAKFDFGGPRVLPILGICVHTTQNRLGTRAENVAQYQLDKRNGSYHRLVDGEGRILMENTDDWTTWSTGNQGNDRLLHVAVVCEAEMTREAWLGPEAAAMFEALAQLVAYWSRTHGIPLIVLDAPDLLADRRGLYGHDDTRAWGGTDHWDPGPYFPWLELAARAAAINNPTAPPRGDTDVTFTQADRDMLTAVRDALLAPRPSLIDPEKSFTLPQFVELIDASTYRLEHPEAAPPANRTPSTEKAV